MIIVALSGGLGNQLFQVALGSALAKTHNFRLVAYFRDLSRLSILKGVTSRQFQLGGFFPGLRILDFEPERKRRVANLLAPLSVIGIPSMNVVDPLFHEPGFEGALNNRIQENQHDYGNFHPGALQKATRGAHLIGYWQTPKYFDECRDLFHSIIRRATTGSRKEIFLRQLLRDEQPIAVHVRRGDYASSRRVRNSHGLLSSRYFETAIDHAVGATGHRNIWVFSEDIDYCRRNIRYPPGTKVRFLGPSLGSLDDAAQLSLMSNAASFVISNSTFSWWAAWASKSTTVFAPDIWNPSQPERFHDIVPEEWNSLQATFSNLS